MRRKVPAGPESGKWEPSGLPPVGDERTDQLALVLLQEVPGVWDDARRLAADRLREAVADLGREDRVVVGPQQEHRPAVLAQGVEDTAPGDRHRVVERARDQQREGAGAGF